MNKTDFTKGSITRSFLRFFFPMLLANILQQIYSFADLVIIGKGLGDISVAAVGNFTTFSFFLTGFTMGITNGFSVNIAQTCGEKDFGKLKKAVASSVIITSVFALLFSAIGLILLKPILQIMNTDDELINGCLSYGHIIFGGFAVTAAYNLLSSILRGIGDSKTPLLAIGISSAINIILDLLTIFLFDLGVSGPAYATVISQLISVVICYFGLRGFNKLKIGKRDFTPDFKLAMNLLKNSLPMAIMNSITSVGCIFVQSCINDYGIDYTSAYSICNKYLNFFMLPGITIGFAASSFAGQNFGAKEYERIRKGTKTASLMAVISALLLGIILFFFSVPLAKLMLTGQRAVNHTSTFLKYLALFIVILNLLFVFRSCIQGLSKPVVPMCSGIVEMVIRIPAIYFGAPIFGFTATVYAEGLAWVGALTLNFISYVYYINHMRKVL
ncbi:MAG: MATE family efflux transporter [Oscillospiraceae bacterium]|nr:MATE family efflux transporter [Oscillospiraceae bacterium]